jgi:hypothetical protein
MRPVGWRIESDQSKTHGLRAVDSIFRISRSWVLELQPFENKTRRHAVQFALTGRSGAFGDHRCPGTHHATAPWKHQ